MSSLPPELLVRVFVRADIPELMHCLRVNKTWSALIRHHTDWQAERRRFGLSHGRWHGLHKPDYTREDIEFVPPQPDPTDDAIAELGRCAWLERDLRRPDDGEKDDNWDMVHSWPEFSSPRRFNGDLLILHKPKGNRPQDCAYQMEDEPSFLWWQHVQYLPDARHFCALIEVNRTRILWLVLFRVGRSTPLVKRELGTAAELGTEAEQHCIEDRLYVVFEQGAAFVLSLPDLQLLRRTAIHSTGRRLGESIVPQGPHRALAVRCQQRRRLLHFYELPALALRRTLKLDDQVWFYKVSEDGRHLAMVGWDTHLRLLDLHAADPLGTALRFRAYFPINNFCFDASLEFRDGLLLFYSPYDGALFVFDVQEDEQQQRYLRLCRTVRTQYCRPPRTVPTKTLFLGRETMILDGRLVYNWRREDGGGRLRQLNHSTLVRLHAQDLHHFTLEKMEKKHSTNSKRARAANSSELVMSEPSFKKGLIIPGHRTGKSQLTMSATD